MPVVLQPREGTLTDEAHFCAEDADLRADSATRTRETGSGGPRRGLQRPRREPRVDGPGAGGRTVPGALPLAPFFLRLKVIFQRLIAVFRRRMAILPPAERVLPAEDGVLPAAERDLPAEDGVPSARLSVLFRRKIPRSFRRLERDLPAEDHRSPRRLIAILRRLIAISLTADLDRPTTQCAISPLRDRSRPAACRVLPAVGRRLAAGASRPSAASTLPPLPVNRGRAFTRGNQSRE